MGHTHSQGADALGQPLSRGQPAIRPGVGFMKRLIATCLLVLAMAGCGGSASAPTVTTHPVRSIDFWASDVDWSRYPAGWQQEIEGITSCRALVEYTAELEQGVPAGKVSQFGTDHSDYHMANFVRFVWGELGKTLADGHCPAPDPSDSSALMMDGGVVWMGP